MKYNLKFLIKYLLATTIILGIHYNSYSQSNEQLFQKALIKEEGEGLLKEAIDIYSKILNDPDSERSLQANSLLHIANCYEKLGVNEAVKIYNKILEQYSDQQAIFEIAKVRLESITGKTGSKSVINYRPTSTEVPLEKIGDWDYAWNPRPFDFSPNGKRVIYMGRIEDPEEKTRLGNVLFTSDVSGSPVDVLIEESKFYGESHPTFSPDGKFVAFFGMSKGEGDTSKDYSKAIYIVDYQEGKPIQVGMRLDNTYSNKGLIWHPNGKHLSYLTNKGIETIDLNGNITDKISLKVHWSTTLTGYSPSGKWISYYAYGLDDKGDRNSDFDCFLISSDGKKQSQITKSKGFDGFGTWSESDDFFYFVSERNGDRNIFKINVNSETGERIGEASQFTYYYNASVFSPNFIKEKSTLTFAIEKKIPQILIPFDDKSENYKTIASGNVALLSPDGKTVYYEGVGKNNQGIYAISLQGGDKKRLTDLDPNSFYDTYNYLSPDGTTIAFFTKNGENKMQLCFLSTENGKILKSVVIDFKGNILPAWSPDGKKVTYAYNGGLYTIPIWAEKAEKLAEIGIWEPWSIRWSPDGQYIGGFVYLENEKENHIMLVSTQNGTIKRLNSKAEDKYKEGLEWHPESQKLTYMYYDPNNDNDGLREAYVDGRPTTQFINQPKVWDYIGKWGPDGKNYYFRGSYRGNWRLYKYNSETNKTTLFSDITNTSLPYWNSNGKFMVLSRQKKEFQLWMLNGLK